MLNRSPKGGKSKPKLRLSRSPQQIWPKCSIPSKCIKKTFTIQTFPRTPIMLKRIPTIPILRLRPQPKTTTASVQSFPKLWMKTLNISKIDWSTCSIRLRLTQLDNLWAWKSPCLSIKRTPLNQTLKSTCKCMRKNIKNFWQPNSHWFKRQRIFRKRPSKLSLCQATSVSLMTESKLSSICRSLFHFCTKTKSNSKLSK